MPSPLRTHRRATIYVAEPAGGVQYATTLHRVVLCMPSAETQPVLQAKERISMTTNSQAMPAVAGNGNVIRPQGVWIVAGGLAVAGLALAGSLAWQAATGTPASAQAQPEEVILPAKPVVAAKPAAAPKPAAPRAVVAACATCGVIESVQAVKYKGDGTGLGAVAGGVAGAVLGNQVGKGNGRKAMTVIGAVGGGMAGHEIEKQARATTAYEVRVRMEDGTVRTLERATAPPVGQRVRMDGKTMTFVSSGA
jgi:outer membrane lipoprotein SlyB